MMITITYRLIKQTQLDPYYLNSKSLLSYNHHKPKPRRQPHQIQMRHSEIKHARSESWRDAERSRSIRGERLWHAEAHLPRQALDLRLNENHTHSHLSSCRFPSCPGLLDPRL